MKSELALMKGAGGFPLGWKCQIFLVHSKDQTPRCCSERKVNAFDRCVTLNSPNIMATENKSFQEADCYDWPTDEDTCHTV